MEWKIIGSPKTRVISNRIAMIDIPGWFETGFRQVVVRVQSRQSLQVRETATNQQEEAMIIKTKRRALAWTPGGAWTANEAQPKKKDNSGVDKALQGALGNTVVSKKQKASHDEVVVEYMVLQKWITQGKEGPWKIWGFAPATTLESVRADEATEQEHLEYKMQNSTSA